MGFLRSPRCGVDGRYRGVRRAASSVKRPATLPAGGEISTAIPAAWCRSGKYVFLGIMRWPISFWWSGDKLSRELVLLSTELGRDDITLGSSSGLLIWRSRGSSLPSVAVDFISGDVVIRWSCRARKSEEVACLLAIAMLDILCDSTRWSPDMCGCGEM